MAAITDCPPPSPPPSHAVLAKVKAVCPEILSLLVEFEAELGTLQQQNGQNVQQEKCDSDRSGNFIFTDASWLSHLELVFVLRSHRGEAFRALRRALAVGPTNDGVEATPAGRKAALMAVEELLHGVEAAAAKNLASVAQPEGLPLVVHLAQRYSLTPSESDLFQLLFMRGASRSTSVRASSVAKCDEREQAMEMCGMSSLDLEDFLDDKRTHIVEGIVLEAGDEYDGKTIRMASEAVSALLRRPLKTEQRLKLSKTELLNVMEASEGKLASHIESNQNTTEAPSIVGMKRKRLKREKKEKPSAIAEQEDDEDLMDDSTKDLMGELREMEHMQTGIQLSSTQEKVLAEMNGTYMEGEAVDQLQGRSINESLAGIGSPSGINDTGVTPYGTSLEYLDDAFQILALLLRIAKARHKEDMKEACNEDRPWYDSFRPSKVSSIRELRAKLRFAQTKQRERLKLTEERQRQGLGELPRLEALSRKLGLDEFEKGVVVMLTGVSISPIVKSIFEDHSDASYRKSSESVQVKDMVTVFFDTFKEQVLARPYFYKSSKLASRGVIKMRAPPFTRNGGDLMDQQVELDRRMLDWVVGLDTEMNELVEGSHLYTPKITMEQVVLPEEQKKILLQTVNNFGKFKLYRQKAGLEDAIHYGAGLVILLCGASGTGKTMTVNALANHLGSLSSGRGEDNSADLRGLFRDAEMNDAVIFFDECEAIFAQREKGGDRVLNALLTEMERHEGIIMLATNRPLDLDEAMHRRITCVSEFRPPDHTQRRDIWRVASQKLPISPDIDWDRLALRYELTGGYIKNALVGALLLAISRESISPIVTEEDVVTGCSLQMRGSLQMKSFTQRVVPKNGLDELVLSKTMLERILSIVGLEKARGVLQGQWGFQPERLGVACLFWGPQGTGKSAAAEAIGFEVGRPLKVVSCAQLLSPSGSPKTGTNISAAFKDARLMDAVLVLEDFQVLGSEEDRGDVRVSSVSPWSSAALGLLLHELQRFPGTCILIANIAESSIARRLDPELLRRLKFVLEFKLPDQAVRTKMWQKMLPTKVPISNDVNFEELGKRFEFTSGAISSSTVRAAAKAALRPANSNSITMRDLMDAAEIERNHLKDEIDEIVLRAFL